MGHTAPDLDTDLGHVTKLIGVVGPGIDRLGKVLTHLVLVDIDGSYKINIADMIPTKIDMHNTGNRLIILSFPIIMDALNQRRSAITNSNNSHIYLTQSPFPSFPGQ